MKDRKLATRYARALLSSLPDAPTQDAAGAFLEALVSSLDADPRLKAALVDPAVPSESKTSLLEALAASKEAHPRVASFLGIVVANGRVASLPLMTRAFREELERARGLVSGTLTTAAPISAELTARAAAALSQLSGRRVQLEARVDPGLVGGAVAQVGSMVYDGSVRTQLGRLRHKIGEE